MKTWAKVLIGLAAAGGATYLYVKSSKKVLSIISATYGAGASVVNVTSILNSMIANGSISVSASNSNFGDPAPGAGKVLNVNYQLNGETYQVAVPEHSTLTI